VHSDGDLKRRTTQVSAPYRLPPPIDEPGPLIFHPLEHGPLCEEGRAFAHGSIAPPRIGLKPPDNEIESVYHRAASIAKKKKLKWGQKWKTLKEKRRRRQEST